MRGYFRDCLILAIVLNIHPFGAGKLCGEQTAEADSQITVCIYNQAQVSQLTINRAREMAISLFRQAGISMVWLDCSPYLKVKSLACRSGIGPAYLSLRISQGPGAAGSAFLKSATGFAALTAGQRGVDANVFYRRIEEIAKKQHVSNFRILGIAMAHEVGHLLLGSNSHSRTGIMRPDWKREELVPGGVFLGFTPQEAGIMRADMSARRKQQAVLETSGFELPK